MPKEISDSQSAEKPSKFLILPLEIRHMVYEEVFSGAEIVLSGSADRHYPDCPQKRLFALLYVCRQCHLEAFPILYSSTVMRVGDTADTETIHQSLRSKGVQLIKTLHVDELALEHTLGGPQSTNFVALTKLFVHLKGVDFFDEHSMDAELRYVCNDAARCWRILWRKIGIYLRAIRKPSTHLVILAQPWGEVAGSEEYLVGSIP